MPSRVAAALRAAAAALKLAGGGAAIVCGVLIVIALIIAVAVPVVLYLTGYFAAPKPPSLSVNPSGVIMEGCAVKLTCSSDANPAATYTWYKEGRILPQGPKRSFHFSSISSEDSGSYHCKSDNKHGGIASAPLFLDVQYAPKRPSVSVSPSGDIKEGSSVKMTCSSDANPAATYTWYKEDRILLQGPERSFHFSSISSEDSGSYHCKSDNKHGGVASAPLFLDVQYAPKRPSVSVSPSGDIKEGSSVKMTCSSDANPAATYTWYKEDRILLQGPERSFHFSSISSEDSGSYHCKSDNKHGGVASAPLFLDVQYAPKRPSVSVSPSGDIKEGSSVKMTCSSDANPAATYTWYKEDEDSPKASRQTYTITDVTAEHSGNYHCEALNSRGRHKSSFHLSVAAVVQGQDGWSVTCTPTEICAVEGSTVNIRCAYTHPSRLKVEKRFWLTNARGGDFVEVETDSSGVQNNCDTNSCTLTITHLRQSDTAEYRFMFTTNQRKYVGKPGVTLNVTDLHVEVRSLSSSSKEFICVTSCNLPGRLSAVWYKNGQKSDEVPSRFASYSCALRGYEAFPSAPVCLFGESCDSVIYTNRNICAPKGSSVDISSLYTTYFAATSRVWFRPGHSHQWQSPSQPDDLSEDSQYSGRVGVIDKENGRSTLRISELRKSDSAEYRFKFKTTVFEWKNDSHGTTLTVTDLHVEVRSLSSSRTKLKCVSSCIPSDRLSYIWYKNGEKTDEGASLTVDSSSTDRYFCALRGYEGFPSPPVYAPKRL